MVSSSGSGDDHYQDSRAGHSSHKPRLEKEVEAGRFRRDLWYRLTVFPIFVPPLRDRLEDIPLFLSFFVEKYGKWIGKKFDTISQKTINALKAYSWPATSGNWRISLRGLSSRALRAISG